jgi:hypothetical protein
MAFLCTRAAAVGLGEARGGGEGAAQKESKQALLEFLMKKKLHS